MSDNEMLALADEIDINFRIGADHKFSDAEAKVIQSALRATAASTEPVGYFHFDGSLWHQIETGLQNEGDTPLYTHPAPAAEIVAALEALLEMPVACTTDKEVRENLKRHNKARATLAKAKGGSQSVPTIDDVPSCGQENDYRRTR